MHIDTNIEGKPDILDLMIERSKNLALNIEDKAAAIAEVKSSISKAEELIEKTQRSLRELNEQLPKLQATKAYYEKNLVFWEGFAEQLGVLNEIKQRREEVDKLYRRKE